MKSVSAAFSTAQSSPISEPIIKLTGILRNVAASAEGSTATATDTFSTDYPAAGAIDGDATHLNWGPAAGADNGIGRSGWKSASAAASVAKSVAADWNGGTQTNTKTMDNAAELALTTPSLEQDFDSLTAGTLNGQGGWTVTGSGAATVSTSAAYGRAGNGVDLTGGGASNNVTLYHTISVVSGINIVSFRLKKVSTTDTGISRFDCRLTNAGTILGGFQVEADLITRNPLNNNYSINKTSISASSWQRVIMSIDRTNITSTILKVYVNGLQVDQQTFDSTNLNRLDFVVAQDSTGGQPEYYLDDVRFGSNLAMNGTQENVFDFGVTPASGRATVTIVGENQRVERFLAGGTYSFNNNNADQPVGDTAVDDLIAQPFTVTETMQLDAVWIEIRRIGTPRNCYVQIRSTSGGVPQGDNLKLLNQSAVLATSKQIAGSLLSINNTPTKFTFPVPFVLQSGVTYALVFMCDAVDASNYIIWRKNNASGSGFYYFNLGVWTNIANQQLGYALVCWNQEETGYAGSNANTNEGLNSANYTNTHLAQGFKVSYDCNIRHLWVYLGKNTGATIPANSRIWVEIQTDNSGVPSNTVLSRSVQYHADYISWTTAQMFAFRIPTALTLTAGTQYWFVVRCDYGASTTNFLFVGEKGSAQGYASGNLAIGDTSNSTTPVWTAYTTKALCFSLRGDVQPYMDFSLAYSDDNISYNSYALANTNSGRSASLTFTTTGLAKRYWKLKATYHRKEGGWEDAAWTPVLTSATIKQPFNLSKALTITLGAASTVSRVELYAHPTEFGCKSFKLSYSTDGTNYTDITAYDTTTLESRQKGASATQPTLAGAVVTHGGDYFGGNFTDIANVTNLRVTVFDNVDEWARLLEVRAFRVIDFSSRVSGTFRIASTSDFTLRRIQAKQLSLGLKNDDGYLSPLGTAGGFNGQLGAGMRLIPYAGYTGTEWLKLGVFYVDSWQEQTGSPIVQVSASNGVKLLKTTVRANAKSGYRHFDVVEYLANLAGIPSTDMNIGKTSGFVDYFAPAEVDAYSTCQQVAEAAGFSQLYFDMDGYLTMRSVATTAGNTKVESTTGLTNVSHSMPQFVDNNGLLYGLFCCNGASASTDDLVFASYNPVTSAWTKIATVSNKAWANSKSGNHYGFLGKCDGKIIILDFDTSGTAADVWEYDLTALTLTQVTRINSLAFIPSITVGVPAAQDEYRLFIGDPGGSAANVVMVDLLTYYLSTNNGLSGSLSSSGNMGIKAIVFEKCQKTYLGDTKTYLNNEIIIARNYTTVSFPNYTTVEEVVVVGLDGGHYTTGLTIDTVTQNGSAPSLVRLNGGLANDGNGGLYGIITKATDYTRFYKIDATQWTLTSVGQPFDTNGNVGATVAQRAAYANGIVVCAYSSSLDTINTRGLASYNITYDKVALLGQPAFYAYAVNILYPVTLNGQLYVYSFVDTFRLYEMHMGNTIEAQSVSVFTISDSSGGLLLGSTLDAGDDSAGNSLIVNLAVVKSRPWASYPSEQVWQAPQVPIGLTGTGQNRIQLSYPCVPGSLTVTATYDMGGAATYSFTNDPQQPVMTITPTAGTPGRITSLSVSGQPYRQGAQVVCVAVGNVKSVARYGIRKLEIQNDFIYDPMSQAFIARDLVDRSQDNHIRITDLKSMAYWNMELFDRVTLVDSQLSINTDFWVSAIDIDWFSQTAKLGVVKVIGT